MVTHFARIPRSGGKLRPQRKQVMAAVKTALDAVAKADTSAESLLFRRFSHNRMGNSSEIHLSVTSNMAWKEHKLPALMQAIAVMPVLEPWTVHSSSTLYIFLYGNDIMVLYYYGILRRTCMSNLLLN